MANLNTKKSQILLEIVFSVLSEVASYSVWLCCFAENPSTLPCSCVILSSDMDLDSKLDCVL